MSLNSGIQWTNHTLNFWTGCKKVSDGCKYCYMYRDMDRYGKDPKEIVKVQDRTVRNVIKKAKKGDKIFVCSWSDFFIEEADIYRDWAWKIIKENKDYQFQILTKRPERIKDCLPSDWGQGYSNVWLGISIENQKMANLRMPILSEITCKYKFLSIEPILGEIDLLEPFVYIEILDERFICFSSFDWVIVGGESGNKNGKYLYRKSELEWYRKIVRDCDINGKPLFVKQLGTHLKEELNLKDRHGGDIDEFPEYLKVREFPNRKKVCENCGYLYSSLSIHLDVCMNCGLDNEGTRGNEKD